MGRWLVDVVKSARRLLREEPALFVICLFLLLRLLLHRDSYLTIRDLDFLPHELRPHFHWTYRGGRPLTLFLNQLWLNLLGPELALVKSVVGTIGALLLAPLTLLLATRAGLSIRARGVALALVLGSAPLFASYDSLGPYFLLTLCVLGQFVALVDALDERADLVPLGMFSMIALMVHRNALVTTAAAGLVLLWVRRRRLLRSAGDVMVALGTLAFGLYRVLLSLPFDRAAAERQLAVYSEAFFLGAGPVSPLTESVRKILSILPDLVFAESGTWLVALPLCAAVLAGLFWARPRVSAGFWWASVVGVAMSLILGIIQEMVAADFFFRPNHTTYTLFWVPGICVLVAATLDRFPRLAVYVSLLLLVAVNLWVGDGFRKEALEPNRYLELLRDPRWNDPPVVQFPSFVANIYHVEHWRNGSDGSVAMERQRNDFRTKLGSDRFVVDIFAYREMGEPMYRYEAYQGALARWAEESGYLLRAERHGTVIRNLLIKVQDAAPLPYFAPPR